MNFIPKICRIFNLKEPASVSFLPGKQEGYENDSYSSFIFVLIDYLNDIQDESNVVSNNIKNYFQEKLKKITININEIPEQEQKNYIYELLDFCNIQIDYVEEYLTHKNSKDKRILNLSKLEFLNILFTELNDFKNNIKKISLINEEINYTDFSIENGKIKWTGTMPFLAMILTGVLKEQNILNDQNGERIKGSILYKYFFDDPALLIYEKAEKYFIKEMKNYNSKSRSAREQKLCEEYLPIFLELNKNRCKNIDL